MLEYLVRSILPGYKLPALQTDVDVSELLHYRAGASVVVLRTGRVEIDYAYRNCRSLKTGKRRVIAVKAEPVMNCEGCEGDECWECGSLYALCVDMTEGWLDTDRDCSEHLAGEYPVSQKDVLSYLCDK